MTCVVGGHGEDVEMTGGKRAGECEICDEYVKDLWAHMHVVHGIELEPIRSNKPGSFLCQCSEPDVKLNGECRKCGKLALGVKGT